jgi:hypothetical protein
MSCVALQCNNANANQTSTLVVDASDGSGRPIPKTLFGIFFEVREIIINHCIPSTFYIVFDFMLISNTPYWCYIIM